MPKPDLSLVVVTHHSAEVLPSFFDSLRSEVASLGLLLEVIAVEQSESAREAEQVALLGPDQLLASPNMGYAAGVNRGLAIAKGETVLIANPDIVFQPGSMGALLQALDEGWDIVGPQLELAGVLFPPAEEQSFRAEWARQRARTSGRRNRGYLKRHFGQASAIWEASMTQPVATLSGCLLACRRRVAEALGPWDADYFLYFEETDWLERARRRRFRIGQVPTARVVHAWGHSA
ncbi:MAG: glycosyltransferase, partial [Thermoanaerobaculia bacterium]|nr:glycosyltransferase [Thermoanaerobaculia bacterium]